MGKFRVAGGRLLANIRKFIWEILLIALCLALAVLTLLQKEGYHMDEMICFELANAEYNPWIVPVQPEGRLAKFVHNEIDGESFGETVGNLWEVLRDVLENGRESKLLSYKADVYEEPVWIDRETFWDYIRVDGEDDFQLLSVYFNVKDDNHPPLHFMLIHLMTSLFRSGSLVFIGGAVNLLILAGDLILLCRLGGLFAEGLGMEGQGRLAGLLAVILYGISAGALDTVLLFRMYGLVTFFCLAYLYVVAKKWIEGKFAAGNGVLILVTVGGFLTQYFFLFYCLILALVTAICLFAARRRRELFCFVRSQIMAALLGVMIFPFAISDVFQSGRGVEALDNLAAGLSGYGERLLAFGEITLRETLGISGFAGLAALTAVLVLMGIARSSAGKRNDLGGTDRTLLWMLLLPPVGYFLCAARMSPYLVDRYVMPLFPMIALAAALTVAAAVRKFAGCPAVRGAAQRRVVVVCVAAVCAFQVFRLPHCDGHYLYRGYDAQIEIAEEYRELPCICVYRGYGFYENLEEFVRYERTLLLQESELEDRADTASLESLEQVIVLCKAGVDAERTAQLLGKLGLEREEILFSDQEAGGNAHGDTVFLFSRSHGGISAP